MCKNQTILKEIIFKYHPDFEKSKTFKEKALANPNWLNVEFLVEETLSIIGKYKHVDGDHADFSDGSDSKTASISSICRPNHDNLFAGCIGNVVSKAGVPKAGALRCIIYNPTYDRLMYYFLPKEFWVTILEKGAANCDKIRFTYNLKNDSIAKFETYRVPNFEVLARKKNR